MAHAVGSETTWPTAIEVILTGQGHDHRCEGTSAGAVSQESGSLQQRGDVTLALEGACQAEKEQGHTGGVGPAALFPSE